MHFGTFQLTLEGIDEPVIELAESVRGRGMSQETLRAPEFGESIRLQAL
jgi:hypothetical protein